MQTAYALKSARVTVLPYKGGLCNEIRPLYFRSAFGLPVVDGRIVSFGDCNFNCPYCKRNGAFRNPDGTIIKSRAIDLRQLFRVCDDAVAKGQMIRLSGGDPVMYPTVSYMIGKYMLSKHQSQISIAHNGSSPRCVKTILPFLDNAAIDLKALPHDMGIKIGLGNKTGERMFYQSILVQNILANNGILVDIRTPIFGDTEKAYLEKMAYYIVREGNLKNKFWAWRLYKPTVNCSFSVPDQNHVIKMLKEIKSKFPSLKMGLRAKWEPEGFLYF